MKDFWALVNNTQKIKKTRCSSSGFWWKIYVIFFVVLALAGYSLAIYQGKVGPYTLLIAIPYLLFISFGLSLRSIKQEWRSQTVTWWLTLPYSRGKLLSAKLIANFLHFLRIIGSAAAISTLMAMVGLFLNPGIWTVNAIIDIAWIAAKLYVLSIILSPLAITLGMLFAIMIHSKLKPALPIVWAMTVYLFITVLNHALRILGVHSKGGSISIVPQMPLFNPMTGIYLLIVSLVVSAIFFGLSTYILSEQTEV